MTTAVRTHTTDVLAIEAAEVNTANLTTCASEVTVDRAEFLAAVATELDVIVIDKTTLPETHVGDGKVDFIYGEQGHVEPIPQGIDADELIALGLALKAHPPIDEAQVDALARGIQSEAAVTGVVILDDTSRNIARRLVAAGVRAPQAGDPK